MKKYLAKVASFLGFGTIVYLMFIVFAGMLLPQFFNRNLIYTLGGKGFMHSRIKDLKTNSDIDLLILGSSRAYRGFDVRLFESHGIKTFNLGSSNQTPIQTLVLVNRYLDELKPKKVIFEVNPDIFSNDGVESAIDILSNGPIDRNSFAMCLDINDIKVYNTMIFATIMNMLGKRENYKEANCTNSDCYIKNGYVQSLDSTYIHDDQIHYFCKIKTNQMQAFDKIIQLLKSKNIEVYLVQSPVLLSTYTSCGENATFNSSMSKIGNYTDYNLLFPNDDRNYFLDDQHLNQKGVVKFNEMVLEKFFTN